MPAKRTWFITGCSRGFGLALAEAAFAHGERVVATARRSQDIPEAFRSSPNAVSVDLDVTDEKQIANAVRRALDAFGQIDVLVNNAGFGMIGAIEETAGEEVRAIFDVNVSGLLAVTRAVLPSMRARRQGRIINVSSAAGYTGAPGWGVYGATKWAVQGLTHTLAMELADFGIKATAVALDSFDTGFMNAARRTSTQLDAYAEISGVAREMAAQTGSYGQKDVRIAADVVFRATREDETPLSLPIGSLSLNAGRAAVSAFTRDLDRWTNVALAGG